MIIEPIFCSSRFSTGRLLAIEDFTFTSLLLQGALTKRKQLTRDASEGKADQDLVAPMEQRSDTVAYALMAEVRNFDIERQKDFKLAVTKFLSEQISFYQKVSIVYFFCTVY